MTNNRPIKEVRAGSVRLAIWENQTDNGPRYSVTPTRLYKDADGQWKDSTSLNPSDLGNLVIAAISASHWIQQRTSETSEN